MTSSATIDAIAAQAVGLIPDGAAVGLGTGRAATAFLHELGRSVKAGLRVRGVATSIESENLARELGIPLSTLAAEPVLDIYIDGADEVDPAGNLIKGYGAALVREKVVAAISKHLVILVGQEKIVPVLGTRGKLPVEIVPFAESYCRRELAEQGFPAQLRLAGAEPLVSDNGNFILDCQIGPVDDPQHLERTIRAIPGVIGTGLFLGHRPTVLVAD